MDGTEERTIMAGQQRAEEVVAAIIEIVKRMVADRAAGARGHIDPFEIARRQMENFDRLTVLILKLDDIQKSDPKEGSSHGA